MDTITRQFQNLRPLPVLHPIRTPVRRLSLDTLRLCELTTLERQRGLSEAEQIEYHYLGDLLDRRAACEAEEQRLLAEANEDVPDSRPTPAQVDELARIDHSRRHRFPAPHEI